MRLRSGGFALLCAFVIGCGHKPPPKPVAKPTPPPAKGDKFEFKGKQGDAPKAKVKVVIEQEQAAKGGKALKVAFTIEFSEEETVDVVSNDGSQQVTARFVDAVGTAGEGAKGAMVDDLALAIDELKIQFKRSPRGAIDALTFAGLRKPLEEATARAIFNAVYLAGRGPVFSDDPVEPTKTWKGTQPLPPSSGLTGEVSYTYTYKAKDGTVANVTCEGTVDAKGSTASPQLKLTGTSTNDVKFDLDAGKLLSNVFDATTQTEGGPANVKQHIHIEWTGAAAPASSTAPAPASSTAPASGSSTAPAAPSGQDADEQNGPPPAAEKEKPKPAKPAKKK
jgi:hypothetical protein